MTNERDNLAAPCGAVRDRVVASLTPSPKLAVPNIRRTDVFAERHETQLVIVMIVLSFLVSVATVYGIVLAVSGFLS